MKNVSPAPAMAALGWLLSSTLTPEERTAKAIEMLRIYKFDEGKPLAKPLQNSPCVEDIKRDIAACADLPPVGME